MCPWPKRADEYSRWDYITFSSFLLLSREVLVALIIPVQCSTPNPPRVLENYIYNWCRSIECGKINLRTPQFRCDSPSIDWRKSILNTIDIILWNFVSGRRTFFCLPMTYLGGKLWSLLNESHNICSMMRPFLLYLRLLEECRFSTKLLKKNQSYGSIPSPVLKF